MDANKNSILNNICYTELVYDRINKKLKTAFSKIEIEAKISNILKETDAIYFQKIGKNFYVSNPKNNIRITINSNTFRIITVDLISNLKNKTTKIA